MLTPHKHILVSESKLLNNLIALVYLSWRVCIFTTCRGMHHQSENISLLLPSSIAATSKLSNRVSTQLVQLDCDIWLYQPRRGQVYPNEMHSSTLLPSSTLENSCMFEQYRSIITQKTLYRQPAEIARFTI